MKQRNGNGITQGKFRTKAPEMETEVQYQPPTINEITLHKIAWIAGVIVLIALTGVVSWMVTN